MEAQEIEKFTLGDQFLISEEEARRFMYRLLGIERSPCWCCGVNGIAKRRACGCMSQDLKGRIVFPCRRCNKCRQHCICEAAP